MNQNNKPSDNEIFSSEIKIALDNLLNFRSNDSCIFVKPSELKTLSYFDLAKTLGKKVIHAISNSAEMEVDLNSQIYDPIVDKISKAQTYKDMIAAFAETDIFEITEREKEKLVINFEIIKEDLIARVKKQIKEWIFAWKDLAQDHEKNYHTNSAHTLYLGFFFFSYQDIKNKAFAPLFFKQANIDYSRGKIILKVSGNVIVNEKLLLFMENKGISLNLDNIVDSKINDLIQTMKVEWKGAFNFPDNFESKIADFDSLELPNEEFEIRPGYVVGLFQPQGAYPRRRMKEIIANDELDSMFNISFDKTIYKKSVSEKIKDPNTKLVKIQNTNLSQDAAIISSLIHDTIIWGPPGTGKSQVISNIVANNLINGKTTLISSEKKVALEVILNRLGSLGGFCLNFYDYGTSKAQKQKFYAPIINILNKIGNFDNYWENLSEQKLNVFTQTEIEFIELASEFVSKSNSIKALEAIYYYAENNPTYKVSDIEFILGISENYKIPEKIDELFVKKFLKENKISLLSLKRKKAIEVANSIKNTLSSFEGNLALLFDKLFELKLLQSSDINILIEFQKLALTYEKLLKEKAKFKPVSSEDEVANVILTRLKNLISQYDSSKMNLYKKFIANANAMNLPPDKFVRVFKEIIKDVFPVMITKIDENLSQYNKNDFDYVLIDEASQIQAERGIPALYLGKIKILSGDDMQMQPYTPFVARKINETVLGSIRSLLHYAISLGIYKVFLNKNYRSKWANLINFSSKNFYSSNLDAIDENSSKHSPSIEVYNVDGVWDNSKNFKEAVFSIKKIIESLPKYKKIIFISLNQKQSDYVLSIIYEKNIEVLIKALNSGQLLIRNIENAQGDEGDLIIFSVSYDRNTMISSTRLGQKNGRFALNVSISRAKEKMIVYKSIYASEVTANENEDLKLFREWLNYLDLAEDQKLVYVKSKTHSYSQQKTSEISKFNNSFFIDHVYSYLKEVTSKHQEYKIYKDYQIGSITLDLAIVKNNSIYKAIKFDSFDYEKNIKRYGDIYDEVKYLQSKKYDVVILDPISWLEKNREIPSWFKESTMSYE
ncbi:DEAD/DEAH box helicase [Mycoplasmopsis synoviae]|uniref:DEAD/DEAH box helicase n=1 Tax=Mycoplasmopsis synoviae TaxID=2109 RepID=UPI0034DB35D6